MRKMMAAASCAAMLLAVPAQAGIQDAPQAQAAPAEAAAATPECKPKKKKKGLGLGGLLRAARNSGLVGSVAGKVGGDSYLANAATSTALDVAASQAAKQSEAVETPQC